ncbi:MAG: tryptophan--tRNA ligase [Solirubrobacterales bacterium]
MTKKRILTGDRPTGKLHLGHYVGSLENRVALQHEYDSFIIIADVQALTTNFDRPDALKSDILEIAADYLAAGLDPNIATIFIQSHVPAIHELAMYLGLVVSVNVLRANPTIKTEAAQYGFKDMTYGFLGYPVSQAADICAFKADLVPVGEDQIPHIELTRKLARRFNDLYDEVLVEPKALIGKTSRLVGLDGKAKMSKSLNNAIFLSDAPDEVLTKVKNAVTDPARIRATDPGHPDICTIYAYRQVFTPDAVPEICEACKAGKIGCVACKKDLSGKLNELLEPMRTRRAVYENRPDDLWDILKDGTRRAIKVTEETLADVRQAMQINYY